MYKLTLIYPGSSSGGLNSIPFFKSFPPQGLIQLASLTPPDWDVLIINENDTVIDFEAKTDLVGLSAMTSLAPRAYKIAREFKKRNIPVIMGGIHASMLPEEASQYVDSVVIGEADLIWKDILEDFKSGQLKPIYKAETPNDLDFYEQRYVSKTHAFYPIKKIPIGVNLAYIQTQRGCPNGCKFCSVSAFNGKIVRKRTVSKVIEDIKREKFNNFKSLIIWDDNVVADKEYAKKLFIELAKLKIKWIGQADIRIADDDIIDLARKSGLLGIFLGLESINAENLDGSVSKIKESWRSRYEEAIKKLRQRGIMIEAGFIFGFDGEDHKSIDLTIEWAIKNKIDLVQFGILTPMPGTALFKEIEMDKRVLRNNWVHYNAAESVFKPVGWEQKNLEANLLRAYRRFYSFRSIFRRLNFRLPIKHFIACFLGNLEFRKFKI